MSIRSDNLYWLDMKMSNNKWLAGGFPINDHEIENPGPKEVDPDSYVDLSPLGDWVRNVPTFASNATDDDKSGIVKRMIIFIWKIQ